MPASTRTPFPLSARAACTAFAAAALALLAATTAVAEEKTARARAAAPSCIEVEVNGQKAPPSFDCLTQKLQPAPNPEAAARDAMPLTGSEAIAARPSNQIGLFNRAALSNRMGNTFGTSVHPQRPQK